MRAEHDTISGVSSLRHPASEVTRDVHPAAAPEVGPISYLELSGERERQRLLNEFYAGLLNLPDAELYKGAIVREVADAPELNDVERVLWSGYDVVGRIQDPTCSPGRAAHIVQDVGWRTQHRTGIPGPVIAAAIVGTVGFWAGVVIGAAWLIAG